MKNSLKTFFAITVSLFLLTACNSDLDNITQAEDDSDISLFIPAGFDFSTHQKVTINIVENAAYAKYDVYAYSDNTDETLNDSEILERLIFSGVPKNGVLKQTINVPTYYNKVYIRRIEGVNLSTTIKDIVNQQVNFNSSEAKSAVKSTSNKNLASTDTDGDGIFDDDDAYPNDPKIAFEYFTPSKDGRGTLAFEDLWPSTVDYDFNDLALRYKVKMFLNADNLAVGFDFEFKVISNRAGSYIGFGFEMEGIAPSQIESVTNPRLTFDIIKLNPNRTEAGQKNAVIIVTDAIRFTKVGNEFISKTISVKFLNPISTANLGVAPFNPFIFTNKYSNTQTFEKVRDREVHLPNRKPTSLGIVSNGFDDPDGTYISKNGYPWGLSIIEGQSIVTGTRPNPYFRIPKDTVNITRGYKFFKTWAESGGSKFKNWYSNGRGYRNESLLQELQD
ncbi:MAG: LruC domain-containing protein [Flavobacteriia bacterium]|nr:LruC domain-containing protein [Flavobacteriia bacterium]OIP48733.1 MAG: hypothetical protein AUK46_00210 [Flavobacteriaceae bacterium CG2_30_31_66]PIV95453.1 MAG: hypothetical protein COW43_13035 [Flavobacteriaceae bacterium CG17_big_fil_post_rev_8_21_14_2_50_31_13]PIY14162.1 MAG: hypothetical protein COZ16_10195 [Flavobacteriaceae bacterium CG_4_10_14_3_um_filter_31_253]PIZ10271.1 MAG: hypothetical protein COY55_08935 [Flavobacteriaceae bacterium CG_4_10_14_0_8_um_filter_31_99]PJC10349.1 